MVNFWSFLLNAFLGLANFILIPLFGGPQAYHQAMGFAQVIGQGAYVVLEVAYSTFGIFNLTLVGVCLGLVLLLTGIKIGFLVVKVVIELFKMATIIFA